MNTAPDFSEGQCRLAKKRILLQGIDPPAQRPDGDAHRCNGICAFPGLTGMGRLPVHAERKPEAALVCSLYAVVRRLRIQHETVSIHPAQCHGLLRAMHIRFLITAADELQGTLRQFVSLAILCCHREEGRQGCREAALHVAAPPSIEPPVLNHRAKRIPGPVRPERYRILMTDQHQLLRRFPRKGQHNVASPRQHLRGFNAGRRRQILLRQPLNISRHPGLTGPRIAAVDPHQLLTEPNFIYDFHFILRILCQLCLIPTKQRSPAR